MSENTSSNDELIQSLPDINFLQRPVVKNRYVPSSRVVTQARNKLKGLIGELEPGIPLNDPTRIEKRIEELKSKLSDGGNLENQREILKQKLTLFKDYYKLLSIEPITIPQTKSHSAKLYYTLPDTVGGVTEKLALISNQKLIDNLQNLIKISDLNLGSYIKRRRQFNLEVDAIVKLPKHGDIRQIQREHIALNLSRILGLQTCHSSLVSYDNVPALFVPFDEIELLNQVASGQIMHARLFSNKLYSHYSTLNPIGEGLQPNEWVKPLGEAMGLAYLCSDTDFVGGYNQNKAIKDNRLYVFDQILMQNDKLKLDSRLSLVPSQNIMKHTRHGQGRNRTLVEDTSLQVKFDAIMNVKRQASQIASFFQQMIASHRANIEVVNDAIQRENNKVKRKTLNNKLSSLQKLLEDVEKLSRVVEKRVANIDKAFPNGSEKLVESERVHLLALEKLINHPRLYTLDGRPYQAPWTTRNQKKIDSINILKNNDIEIKFSKNVSPKLLVSILENMNPKQDMRHSIQNKSVCFHKDNLKKINEHLLFPECGLELNEEVSYFQDLDYLRIAYQSDTSNDILIDIQGRVDILNSLQIPEAKLGTMKELNLKLHSLLKEDNDKGLIKHLLKKFQFEQFKQLKKLLPSDEPDSKLNTAFTSALKIDRAEIFNQALFVAVKHKKAASEMFHDYLSFVTDNVQKIERCEDKYNEAKNVSQSINIISQSIIKEFDGHLNRDDLKHTGQQDTDDQVLSDVQPGSDETSSIKPAK